MKQKSKFKNTCIVCNDTKFHEFKKYSLKFKKNILYKQCMSCGLIIAPQTKNYDLSKIYNAQYFINMDTGWEKRSNQALKFINMLDVIFKLKKMRICDYGAGNGYLTKTLIEAGYNILAYEPYLNNGTYLDKRYYRTKPFATDVIIMIEVFEHFTDAKNQIKEILFSFNYPKIIIFTTLLTDNNKNIADWWYLNPDAGHYTIWSKKSLKRMGSSEGYRLISFFSFHIFIKKHYKKEYALIKLPSILITVFYNFLKKNIL